MVNVITRGPVTCNNLSLIIKRLGHQVPVGLTLKVEQETTRVQPKATTGNFSRTFCVGRYEAGDAVAAKSETIQFVGEQRVNIHVPIFATLYNARTPLTRTVTWTNWVAMEEVPVNTISGKA